MLLKNGQPCTDVYQYQCDACGRKTQGAQTFMQANYLDGQVGHFMDQEKERDFCPQCTVKFIKLNAAHIPGFANLLKVFEEKNAAEGRAPKQAPDWVKDEVQ